MAASSAGDKLYFAVDELLVRLRLAQDGSALLLALLLHPNLVLGGGAQQRGAPLLYISAQE